jgi:hypothetical protein
MYSDPQKELMILNQHPINLLCLELLRKENIPVDQEDLHLRQVMMEALKMEIHSVKDTREASDLLEYLEISIHKMSPAHFQGKIMGLADIEVSEDVMRALRTAENVYEAGWMLIQDQLSSSVDFR